jgi:lipoprotein-anchoring transpeptidase ErfK/SrfK
MRPRRGPSTLGRFAAILIPIGLVLGIGTSGTAGAATNDARAQSRLSSSVTQAFVAPATVAAPDVRVIVTPLPGAGLAIYPGLGTLAPSQVLPAVNELGSPLVLLAHGADHGWYHVFLPTRPNGAMGWVRATDVTESIPANRVEVSLAAHELRVIRISDGAVLLTSPVGVGRPTTPTPTGEFFVRDHFPTGSVNHSYGPFAFGLSGHSDVFQQFGTGDGRIAIHGTNQPASIGADLSNGCPHVPNDVVLELIAYMPLGTPVVIS